MLMLLLVLHAPVACVPAAEIEESKVWLGMLTQRDSIHYMRPVGLPQTALPGLPYVFLNPSRVLLWKISR